MLANTEATAGNPALVSFCIYTAVVFVLAWLASRKRAGKSFMNEYFLGSRNLGMWAFAFTYAATSASGGSFMGFPAKIYTYGWVMALWIAGYIVVPLVAMGLISKRLNQVARKSGSITVPEMMRKRLGSPTVGQVATLLLVFFQFFFLLAQFKAGAKIMTTLLGDVGVFIVATDAIELVLQPLPWIGGGGVDGAYYLCLGVFAVSVVAYTAWGGFRAVVWTDMMQGAVKAIEKQMGQQSVAAIPFVYQKESDYKYGAGKQGVYVSAPGPSSTEAQGFLPVMMAMCFFAFWPFAGSGQPSYMARQMAFKDTMAMFLTSNAGAPWLAGLLLAAPFAAVMSSVDSFLLLFSSTITRDVYQQKHPDASEAKLKKVSYAVTIIMGVLAVVAMLKPPQFLQDLIVFGSGGLAASFLMPVVLMLYWPRLTPMAAKYFGKVDGRPEIV
eukprot:gene9035-5118_t